MRRTESRPLWTSRDTAFCIWVSRLRISPCSCFCLLCTHTTTDYCQRVAQFRFLNVYTLIHGLYEGIGSGLMRLAPGSNVRVVTYVASSQP